MKRFSLQTETDKRDNGGLKCIYYGQCVQMMCEGVGDIRN